jgi:hypothetical protein
MEVLVMRAQMFVLLAFCLSLGGPAFAQESQPRVLMPTPVSEADAATIPAPGPDAAVVAVVEPISPDATPAVEETIDAPTATADPADAASAIAETVADAAPETIVIPIVDPLDNPSTGDEVVTAAQKVKDAWYNKNYPAIAGAIIFLILTLFRLPLFGELTKKIPQRVRILAAVVLSFLAAVLQATALGASWGDALMNLLGTAPAAVFVNELLVESILGNRYKKEEVMKAQLASSKSKVAGMKDDLADANDRLEDTKQ